MLPLPDGTDHNKKNILDHIARLIMGGSLKNNYTFPNELDLAKLFNVSRTTIRDVLRSLESKGLIERKTNVGTRIRSIHSWNLLDQEVLDWSSEAFSQTRFLLSLLELRLIIEPQAASLAAIRANDADLQRIRDDFSRMLDPDVDPEAVTMNTDADIDFHKSIIGASGNLFVSQFGGAIRAALHHTVYLSNKANVNHRASHECHRRVLDAIENRDSEGAYLAMCRVLRNTVSDMGLQVNGLILLDNWKDTGRRGS